jgi:hypothetical protein
LFVVLLLFLVACTTPDPVVVTATPVVTEEPTAEPTADPGEPFQAVNLYPWLKDAVLQFHEEQKGVNNPRMIVMPANMDYLNNMLIERPNGDEDCGWLPPFVYQHPEGLSVEPGWLCGTSAFAEYIELTPGRYIAKMGFYKIRLLPTDGEVWQDGNVTVFPVIYTSTGNSFHFDPQPLPQRGDDVEQIWVIEITEPLIAQVRWSWHIEHASVQGSFVVDQLRLETAPDDFGEDVVVRDKRPNYPMGCFAKICCTLWTI